MILLIYGTNLLERLIHRRFGVPQKGCKEPVYDPPHYDLLSILMSDINCSLDMIL